MKIDESILGDSRVGWCLKAHLCLDSYLVFCIFRRILQVNATLAMVVQDTDAYRIKKSERERKRFRQTRRVWETLSS